jgi:hypothetical protein
LPSSQRSWPCGFGSVRGQAPRLGFRADHRPFTGVEEAAAFLVIPLAAVEEADERADEMSHPATSVLQAAGAAPGGLPIVGRGLDWLKLRLVQ